MSDIAELAAPLAEVREVIETFRHHKIVLPDWAQIFRSAIEMLSAPTYVPPTAVSLVDVVAELRLLVDAGLAGNSDLLNRIAAETAELFESVRPAEIPAPSDDNWAFPGPISA
jgi:hypothetical protein